MPGFTKTRMRHVPCSRFRAALIAVLLSTASAAHANLCDGAARVAAIEAGVPEWVLFGIARVESGRGTGSARSPWPWTTNIEGRGAWHRTRHDAEAAVRAALAAGQRSIDIGCFQVNTRWHGDQFPSPEAMFDPARNAAYAAAFLHRLFEEFGTWERAVAAYHSRTPDIAAAYLARFQAITDESCPTRTDCGVANAAPSPSVADGRAQALPAAARPPLARQARPLIWSRQPQPEALLP